MKIKFSILVCSAICIALLGLSNNILNAQQYTISVGNGNFNTNQANSFPFFPYYESGWSESIFTRQDLMMGGMSAGMIQSMSLYLLTPPNARQNFGNVQIWLANSNLSVFPDAKWDLDLGREDADYQLVFTSSNYSLPSNPGLVTFSFTTPFNYTGNGLLVYICYVDNAWLADNGIGFRASFMGNENWRSHFEWADEMSAIDCGLPVSGFEWNGKDEWEYRLDAQFTIEYSMVHTGTAVTSPVDTRISYSDYNLIRANIQTVESANPLSVNELTVNLSKTAANARIKKLKVYRTGTSDVFAATNLVAELSSGINHTVNPVVTIPITNQTLTAGDNYFWIVAEVDETSICGTSLGADLTRIRLSNVNHNVTSNLPSTVIEYEHNPISLYANTMNYICNNKVDSTFRVGVSGSVISLQWQRLNPSSSTWQNVSNTSDAIRVIVSEVSAGFNKYRLIARGLPGSCNANDTLTLEMVIIDVSQTVLNVIEDLKITVNGKTPSPTEPIIYCMEDDPIFVSHFRGDAFRIEWQYRPQGDDDWIRISMSDMGTATDSVLYFVPGNKFADCEIRVLAYAENICGINIEASAPFPIKIYRNNQYIRQPPKVVNLCAGENFSVTVAFMGEEPISQGWYKDGQPLNIESQTLSITNISLYHTGVYQYVVVADGCGGRETIKSDAVSLFLNPVPEIFNVMSRVRANPGYAAVLRVGSNYAYDTRAANTYQWYKYDAGTNRNIALKDGYDIIGTNSNTLVFTNVTDDLYSYNGNYYFCELSALCGGTTKARSAPIFLLPSANLVIQKHPADVDVCKNKLPTTVNFSVNAFATEASSVVKYQWFEDDTVLVDNAEFNNVNSPVLTVTVANAARVWGKFYCKIWLEDADPNDYELTDSATITLRDIPQILDHSDEDITVKEGDQLVLFVVTDNPDIDQYLWMFIDADLNFTPLPFTTNEIIIDEVSLENEGRYVVGVVNDFGCETISYFTSMEFKVTVEPLEEEEGPITGIEDITFSELKVLPNPASDFISFEFETATETSYTLEIADLSGAVVFTIAGISNPQVLNTITIEDLHQHNLINGTYFVNLIIDDKRISKSFVIAK